MAKIRHKRSLSLYWDDQESFPCSLGCSSGTCPVRDECGGMHIKAQTFFRCSDFCAQCDIEKCSSVCPKKTEEFSYRYQEIGGFGFENIPFSSKRYELNISHYAPCVLTPNGPSSWGIPAVAIPLKRLFYGRTGEIKYSSKEELAHEYKFDLSAQLIITGVAEDNHIENYWSSGREKELFKKLSCLVPSLVCTPNYSMFVNVHRADNLHNMKRIAICWSEMAEAGLPTALHINGRTSHDFFRWSEFLIRQQNITTVSFEFGTGGRSANRGRWMVNELIRLAERVSRPLNLVIRGGIRFLSILAMHFKDITFIDSNPYIYSIKRRPIRSERVFTLIDGDPDINHIYHFYVRNRRERILFSLERPKAETATGA